MKTTRFTVVSQRLRSPQPHADFATQVNKLLAAGWVLHGPPVVSPCLTDEMILQAMVRDDDTSAQPAAVEIRP